MKAHTIEEILNLIKLNKSPYWRLSHKRGLNYIPFASSFDELLANDKELSIEKSIEHFNNVLNLFNGQSNVDLTIEMRPTKTSNKSYVFGPIPFLLNATETTTQPVNGLNGFNGINDFANLGFIPRNEIEIMRLQNEMAMLQLTNEFKLQMSEMKEKNSFWNKAIEALPQLAPIFPSIAGLFGINVPAANLAGNEVQDVEPIQNEIENPKLTKINNLASWMYNNIDENNLGEVEKLLNKYTHIKNEHTN